MGVTGLWTVVQPCARPIKIETLNKKRLAVDASIWIYQFLKAVRDKEGNALRNSHVVGFFRRICKLLFFGIKPVFVFDGGAPALKRQTITGRKQRREGRRDDAVRTAGKLLALQMQRRAEDAEQKRKEDAARPARIEVEEEVPENLVYVDELQMTQKERQQNRKFRKKDQYHLPDLDVSMAEMGGPNDPRVMSLEELEQYARQFNSGEDINVYDFSKIDFDSPFFVSLPASDRYNILNAARLRSRLRMGHSKDQLDTMFPNRMDFSRFQVERVRERNELTQRLMHVNGMVDDAMFSGDTSRVAGERGKEYVLVKNAGVEGGWALGVIAETDEGQRNKPIDVEKVSMQAKEEDEVADEVSEEDDGFEDVPIDGLNRLPKRANNSRADETRNLDYAPFKEIRRKRNVLYTSREKDAQKKPQAADDAAISDPSSLFLVEDRFLTEGDQPQENLLDADDEEDLHRAIAMSLESEARGSEPDEDEYEEVFQQSIAKETNPFSSNRNLVVAQYANSRSLQAAVPIGPSQSFDESDEDTMDLEGALAESRQTKYQSQTCPSRPTVYVVQPPLPPFRHEQLHQKKSTLFDGPLPFEKLDLGSSLLGKKKMKKLDADGAGGFEKDGGLDDIAKTTAPIPPWFRGDVEKDINAQKMIEAEDRLKEKQADQERGFEFQTKLRLRTQDTADVIDVDALNGQDGEVLNLDSSDDDVGKGSTCNIVSVDSNLLIGNLVDSIRVEPPNRTSQKRRSHSKSPSLVKPQDEEVSQPPDRGMEQRAPVKRVRVEDMLQPGPNPQIEHTRVGQVQDDGILCPSKDVQNKDISDYRAYEWEDSDAENVTQQRNSSRLAGDELQQTRPQSPSPEFENVEMNPDPVQLHIAEPTPPLRDDDEDDQRPVPLSGTADRNDPVDDSSDHQTLYSDPEDDELMHQLATEAEEHARFASTLNNKPVRQNAEDYERELKALRNQQKKDRRDADEVTHVMVTECQQLLQLFGLPFITAPMEAEAQCAELVHLGLVDGIVTDDSDIFLFGGTRVYKNMFNQAKFVECYLAADLERDFGLSRHKLIRIAHLLGSDYTEGLPGVGPVTALEIISEFPDGLEQFKTWWARVQTGAKPTERDAQSAFRKKFRKNSAKLFLPTVFPDRRVDAAYLHPDVDSDKAQFVWGIPDLDALRAFLMATIGWSEERTDEVLVPVIRDMNRRQDEGTQANITQFLSGGVGAGAFAPRKRKEGKSRRMESALERMGREARRDGDGEGEDGLDGGVTPEPGVAAGVDNREAVVGCQTQSRTQKKAQLRKEKRNVSLVSEQSGEDDDDEPSPRPKKKKAVPRLRRKKDVV